MSDGGHADPPPESFTASGFHFNTAAVVVASSAAPASLSTGDQQMLIRKINSAREGWTLSELCEGSHLRQVRGRNGARH